MTSARPVLERIGERVDVPQPAFERLVRRRERKRRNQRLAAGAVSLAILVAGLLIGAHTIRFSSQPATTPTTPLPRLRQGGEVAFTTNDGLFGKDPSTGAIRKLADCASPCEFIDSVAWSPNGTMIAYNVVTCLATGPCEPAAGIWVKQADEAPRQLTSPCDPTTYPPCAGELWEWSPHGATIAYARFDRDTTELSLLDPVDGALAPLASMTGPIYALAWSPDGTSIAVASATGISLVTLNGAVSEIVGPSGSIRSIAWSPDGSQLVLDTIQNNDSRIYVVNADGSGPALLADGTRFEGPGSPAWSPDGTKIAYLTTPGRPGDYGVQVWVMDADGSGRMKLFDSGCCGDPEPNGPIWSPDGTKTAYMIGGRWYEVRSDGEGSPVPMDSDVVAEWQQGA